MAQLRNTDPENPIRYIGCCGAYCKTCRSFALGSCKGCKIGLDTGERDTRKAKCWIKICYFGDNRFDTCVDCSKFESCLNFDTSNSEGFQDEICFFLISKTIILTFFRRLSFFSSYPLYSLSKVSSYPSFALI